MNDLPARTGRSARATTPKLLHASALALVTTLAVLVPSTAEARSYVRPDAKGDVVEFDNDADQTGTLVPDRAEGDILTSTVVHAKRRVRMAMHYDELTPAGEGATHFFRIGTKRLVRDLFIDTGPGYWRGVRYFEKDNGKAVRCRGIRWSIDYDADLIRASVPRRCLGRPKWVRVGMGSGMLEDPAAFFDDAETNGYVSANPKWGPRVRR